MPCDFDGGKRGRYFWQSSPSPILLRPASSNLPIPSTKPASDVRKTSGRPHSTRPFRAHHDHQRGLHLHRIVLSSMVPPEEVEDVHADSCRLLCWSRRRRHHRRYRRFQGRQHEQSKYRNRTINLIHPDLAIDFLRGHSSAYLWRKSSFVPTSTILASRRRCPHQKRGLEP